MLRDGLKSCSWLALTVYIIRLRVLTPEAFPGTFKRLRMRNHLYKSVYVRSDQGGLMVCIGEASICEPWVRE